MSALSDLARLAHALGGPAFAQGAGGNVSVKEDGSLWIKASGVRLAHTAEPAGHAVVPLDLARAALAGDPSAATNMFAVRPRPSMETYFHALPARVVVHVHAIGSLLWACAPEGVREPGLPRIAYRAPGPALAAAVASTVAETGADAVLLESHGVIVFGDEVDEALARLSALEARAFADFPDARPFTLDRYLPPEGATMFDLPERGDAGYLFPDAVVYAPRVEVDELETATEHGVLVSPSGRRRAAAATPERLRAVLEIVAAHDWVEDVLVAAGVQPLRLRASDAAALRADPAEVYRKRLS